MSLWSPTGWGRSRGNPPPVSCRRRWSSSRQRQRQSEKLIMSYFFTKVIHYLYLNFLSKFEDKITKNLNILSKTEFSTLKMLIYSKTLLMNKRSTLIFSELKKTSSFKLTISWCQKIYFSIKPFICVIEQKVGKTFLQEWIRAFLVFRTAWLAELTGGRLHRHCPAGQLGGTNSCLRNWKTILKINFLFNSFNRTSIVCVINIDTMKRFSTTILKIQLVKNKVNVN